MRHIIHIGVNKTGTSSVQSAFFGSRDKLRDMGICYPLTGIETCAHHNVSRAVKGAAPSSLGLPEDWASRLNAEKEGAELVVLSSEDFATIGDISPLVEVCPPGDTDVVVYIREHVAHTVSWYQQAIQLRNTAMSLEEYIEYFHVSYERLIRKWQAQYGAERVHVRQYDRKFLAEGDIVTDFCRHVGDDIEKLFVGQSFASNPSVAGNLLFAKRVLNCFITRAESRAMANEVAALTDADPTFTGKIFVPERTVNRLRFLTRDDKSYLADTFDIRFKPPRGDLAGSRVPDEDRLPQDLHLIREISERRGYKFAVHLDRIGDFVGQSS